MPIKITALRVYDVRFPTSDESHGSDAMNPDPDYSAAVAILETDDPSLTGHGLTFTIGRGTEIAVSAIRAVDFRHISDVLSREEALEMLEQKREGRAEREAFLQREGYPAYVTSAGWLGYDEATVRERSRIALAERWEHFKIKVGIDVEHFSAFDCICVSGTLENRITEYADHLHEHFVHPVQMRAGRYRPPSARRLGVEFKSASLREFSFPDGPVWQRRLAR